MQGKGLYLTANIDRAIVMTQYDLRGFDHPLGFRLDAQTSPKVLDAITCNLINFAAGYNTENKPWPTDPEHVDYFNSTFEEYLAMCQRLAADCDVSEREAIWLITETLVSKNHMMHAEVENGQREKSGYLFPLSRDNRWGKAVLALRQAFQPPPKQQAVAA